MSKKPVVKKERINWDAIVYCIDNLDKKQLEEHDTNPLTPAEIVAGLNTLVEDSFEIKVKWDTFNDCHMVTAVCYEQGHDNTGLGISARGDSTDDCLSILLYKYLKIAKRDLRIFADKKPKGLKRG